MKIRTIILLALTGFILASCERTLNIDTPEHETKLVINAVQEPGKPFVVNVSRSYSVPTSLQYEDLFVKDAEVEIWEDGALLSTLTYRDTLVEEYWQWRQGEQPDLLLGQYQNDDELRVEPGKNYELRVNHAELGKVIATTQTTEQAIPDSFSLELDAISETDLDGYVYKNHVARIYITDTPGEENYYSIQLQGVYPIPGDTSFRDTFPFYNNGRLVSYTANSAELDSDFWASDAGADGQQLKLEYMVSGGAGTVFVDNEEITVEPIELILTFYTANADAYRYLNGLDKQSRSDPTNPFFPSEAIVVPGNIDGGYGAFGSKSEVVLKKKF
ncbi:MAG: DUF4249 domain-containing protein [Bacteroidia bacterium]